MRLAYVSIALLCLASVAHADNPPALTDDGGTIWRHAANDDRDARWWFSANKGVTWGRTEVEPASGSRPTVPGDLSARATVPGAEVVTEPPAKPGRKKCACPPGQECQCNVDRPPAADIPDAADYSWVPVPGKPDQIALMFNGTQVGAYRISTATYRPYKYGEWGEPTDPPFPPPKKDQQDSFAPEQEAKTPKHTVDEFGNWWRMPSLEDADQRQWFSLDEGRTWKRQAKPKLVKVSPPVTCRCPAAGNKDGSKGPNNCLCHDREEQCGCHKQSQGGGTVFEELSPSSPQANPPVKPISRPGAAIPTPQVPVVRWSTAQPVFRSTSNVSPVAVRGMSRSTVCTT